MSVVAVVAQNSAVVRRYVEDAGLPFNILVDESREVVLAQVRTLYGQLARIIEDGVRRGELSDVDQAVASRAVFDATARFHNPAHAAEWSDPGIDAAFEGVWSLLVAALGPRA